MVLGLLDQLQIFSQLYLIELLKLLTGLGLPELWHLVYTRLLIGFGILGPTLFLLYITDRPVHVICDIAIYVDDTTLYSKCDQASELWQQLEIESGLPDTENWAKKWLVDFNLGKTQLVSFD